MQDEKSPEPEKRTLESKDVKMKDPVAKLHDNVAVHGLAKAGTIPRRHRTFSEDGNTKSTPLAMKSRSSPYLPQMESHNLELSSNTDHPLQRVGDV